jgi:hypothetical protein
MALPPLELFSLKKRPPCCRVVSSLFQLQLLGDRGSKIAPDWEDELKIFLWIMVPGLDDADAGECEGDAAL